MIFWRQAMSVPFLLGWLIATGRLKVLATSRIATHARRAAVGTVGLLCNISAAMLLPLPEATRSEEHTSELQSLMRISYAVFCLKKKKYNTAISENKH